MTHLKQGDKPEVMLKAVIEKAVKNRYKPYGDDKNRMKWEPKTNSYWYEWDSTNEEEEPTVIDSPFCPDIYRLLFSHSFAKAYFGSRPILRYTTGSGAISEPSWQYHLQKAVLSANPLIYYFEHL